MSGGYSLYVTGLERLTESGNEYAGENDRIAKIYVVFQILRKIIES